MNTITCRFLLMLAPTLVAGCGALPSEVSLAPGADQIKITSIGADVEGCTPVGNVTYMIDIWRPGEGEKNARNQTIGLGGNVLFASGWDSATGARRGIAYRCATVPVVK